MATQIESAIADWYPNLTLWACCFCSGVFIDADEHPDITHPGQGIVPDGTSIKGIEPQQYWLDHNEIACASCAQTRGIPPVE